MDDDHISQGADHTDQSGMAAMLAAAAPLDAQAEAETAGQPDAKYRVPLLGSNGTGKTALVSQFLTSEYMNTYDASLGK